MTYFDNNATTPLAKEAKDAFLQASDELWLNPSSPYRESAKVKQALDNAREEFAAMLGVSPEYLVFTSGATEGNNSCLNYLRGLVGVEKQLLTSSIEHPSVSESSGHIFGDRILFVPVTKKGVLDWGQFNEKLSSTNIGAVSVMAANNETGVLQPWLSIADKCRAEGIPFHCDMSQWLGKMPLNSLVSCDLAVGSAHKFGGPKGIGFVHFSENYRGYRSSIGGGQEGGHRGGTENIAGILAMVAALKSAQSKLQTMSGQALLREPFEDYLHQQLPGTQCVGADADRLPNTSFLIMPKYDHMRWVRKLDLLGFQVSTGSACSTLAIHSTVLESMGYSADESRRSIRVSSSADCSKQDWALLGQAFVKAWEALESEDSSTDLTEVISI